MHNNYHFLKPLTAELNGWLSGDTIAACYSQEKNELILSTESGKVLRAHLDPSFSCLSFPAAHQRARKNSVSLFPEIPGRRIREVRLHENERAFSLALSEAYTLVFKMFGNRSNLLLFYESTLLAVFRTSLKQDTAMELQQLDRPLDLSFAAFLAADGDPVAFCPTLGRQVREHLNDQGFATLDMEGKYRRLLTFIDELSEPPFYVTEKNGRISLSLYETGEVRAAYNSAIEALNAFYLAYTRDGQLNRERKRALDQTGREIEKSLRYIDKSRQTLDKLQNEATHRELADLIMANLHAFDGGKRVATLRDFYNNNVPVEVRLKQGVTPQKHAEQLYRKAKNQHIQVEKLQQNLAEKQGVLRQLEERLEQLRAAGNLKELRALTGRPGSSSVRPDSPEPLPYRSLDIHGFQVWIGKNAKSNDAMLRLCHKNDLWLHAKDVAGSHVIIRQQPGAGFPGPVKERAAALAAYYSRRKQDSLCPVIVTERKYVRKRKGDPAGMVRVDREQEVLLVPPRP